MLSFLLRLLQRLRDIVVDALQAHLRKPTALHSRLAHTHIRPHYAACVCLCSVTMLHHTCVI